MVGAVIGNEAWIQEGFTVATATLAAQNPDGSIGYSPGYLETSNSMFLQAYERALLILRESPYAAKYANQASTVASKLAQAEQWLLQPQQINKLVAQSGASPNRALCVAVALAAANRMAGSQVWRSSSNDFFQDAMQYFRLTSGAFVEETDPKYIASDLQSTDAGADTSYQAVSLLLLVQLYAFYGRDDALPPLKTGMDWELKHIEPNGHVLVAGNSRSGLGQEINSGVIKNVNYQEVLEALELYCLVTNDQNACSAANSVTIYNFKLNGQ
jgi:hypothetical protein